MKIWKYLVGAVVSFRKRYYGFLVLLLFIFFFIILHYNAVQMQNPYFQNDGTYMIAPGWELNKSRNATDYILPDDLTTIITGKNICSIQNPPRVLLIVCSGTENFISRSAIRQTWAHLAHKKFNVSVAFLMGVSLDEEINKKIERENEIYNDVIVEDFIDTYNNLTVKTLMLLKWVKNNCNNTPYIMKTDDDAYINIHNLIHFINNLPDGYKQNILFGKLICNSEPITNPNNKWYMPSYMYPKKVYPDYLSGVGYLMSLDVAMRLYEKAFDIPIIHMEDVFITGICARQAGISPWTQNMFSYQELVHMRCSKEDNYLIINSHKVTYDDMHNIHNKLNDCKTEQNKTGTLNWLFSANDPEPEWEIKPSSFKRKCKK